MTERAKPKVDIAEYRKRFGPELGKLFRAERLTPEFRQLCEALGAAGEPTYP